MRNVASVLAIALVAALSTGLAQERDTRPRLTFAPIDQRFEAAALEYRRIWAGEGDRIVKALEEASGLRFPEREIRVEVFEGVSLSGRGAAPMKLRASYPSAVKNGVLIHELGHRLNAQLTARPAGIDEHRLLFLYLYDVLDALYGKAFADGHVAFEKTLKGLYDYQSAWNWALAMTREERRSMFAGVVRENRK